MEVRITLLLAIVLLLQLAHSTADRKYTLFDISNFGFDNLERFKSNLQNHHDAQWWIEVGDKLLASSNYEAGEVLGGVGDGDELFIIPKVRIFIIYFFFFFFFWY